MSDHGIQKPHLPMTRAEMLSRGWDSVDVVLVTGDAYIDHPSFAMGILGRVLESHGFKVGILSQPNWKSCEPWREFGRPRLFMGVSAGNMDSMINHYTANKKVRNDDAYSPGGRIGLRPDRATLVYAQRCREAFPGVTVIAGGVEASLRRLAHYDYWSDTVKRSILLDSKADLVVYGMGEKAIVEVSHRLQRGETVRDLRDMRGVAYLMGASEILDESSISWGVQKLPSFESVVEDKATFSEATKFIHHHTNPLNAKALTQKHGDRLVVVNPPTLPLPQAELDAVYDLPYSRRPHPGYADKIPAFEMIKDSVTIMRGCFGGCTFCSITAHQGRTIQSRSKSSVLNELKKMTQDPQFKGVVSDMGGPTANMYEMRCSRPDIEAKCTRLSCVHPTVCKLLGTDHGPLIDLMKAARSIPKIRKVFVASGIRMDLAQKSDEYLTELATHHVSGYLKVAPEHSDLEVLKAMKKPSIEDFEGFATKFKKASEKAGKKQYVIPYFIASHPGSDLHSMIDLALFLKKNGYRPDQVQDFIPAPYDIATSMYYTGMDPFTKKPVKVAKYLGDRKLQRALLQFFKPENYFEVKQALQQAGRQDLIGYGCEALIPPVAPSEALASRRVSANRVFKESMTTVKDQKGYRPHRQTARRRDRQQAAPDSL